VTAREKTRTKLSWGKISIAIDYFQGTVFQYSFRQPYWNPMHFCDTWAQLGLDYVRHDAHVRDDWHTHIHKKKMRDDSHVRHDTNVRDDWHTNIKKSINIRDDSLCATSCKCERWPTYKHSEKKSWDMTLMCDMMQMWEITDMHIFKKDNLTEDSYVWQRFCIRLDGRLDTAYYGLTISDVTQRSFVWRQIWRRD